MGIGMMAKCDGAGCTSLAEVKQKQKLPPGWRQEAEADTSGELVVVGVYCSRACLVDAPTVEGT